MDDDRYRWQDEFKARYRELNQKDFTLVACPGSGKTKAALKLAKELIETDEIEFLWIVCPTRQVKKQWWKAAGELGLDIEWKWENGDGAFPMDMSGAAVTYGQVVSEPSLHRIHVAAHRTLVIFDEIHHAEDQAAWGARSREAFDPAVRRLMLSGTPWRPIGTIPFVRYDNGYVKPDFIYGYERAQRDFVCRPIYFPRTGGEVEWEWRDKTFNHAFDDQVSIRKAGQRLRASISADYESINPVAEQLLRDANAKLSQLRAEGETTAGGLVIAMGKDPRTGIRHATALAEHMERMFGHKPPIVVSDDPGALKRIEAFRNSTDRWLVSINMISEGVDIPRLRVLAYLTTVTTELYFDQAAGRICRGTGDAFFFIPDDDVLKGMAQRLADLRKAALKPIQDIPGSEDDDDSIVMTDTGFRSVGGSPSNAGVIFGSHRIDREEYNSAAQTLATSGWPPPVPHEVVAKFALARREAARPMTPEQGDLFDGALFGGLKSDRKEKLRETQNRLVRAYCIATGKDYAKVNNELNQRVGITKLRHATEEQLQLRLKLARELAA